MIHVKNVSKIIKHQTVLSDIDLTLTEGKAVLLQGHNGCGKTMLLRLIAGFITPTTGEITGNDAYRYGVIIENPNFFLDQTAYYNLKYLADINKEISDAEIEACLKKFNLFEIKDKKVSTFSLGMKQRLALCQAFMENPDVLLLDEPFNAIDSDNLDIVLELIEEFKNKGKIIVVASHGDVKFNFDRIITMNNGKILTALSKERFLVEKF